MLGEFFINLFPLLKIIVSHLIDVSDFIVIGLGKNQVPMEVNSKPNAELFLDASK